ncbi:SMP-30/gluconolactonase/LRE family protein [Spirosoma sp. KUDC1026]|uniref:SMP-30/gluconolactonase/LRE family protein n=1 Tax=Spirosoma sp. KUDC1026 TaxID=2745947 RepID=UPI00159B9A6B|nr:SMP-30/gluconolactonase/LRE family protein [Spirosoma sp. KUDC1026]QKZ13771.1 SMP-30/gluconolactonase/LRE family protein [Spirosoma sp. KUDC1026]
MIISFTRRLLPFLLTIIGAAAWAQSTTYATIGHIVRTDPKLNQLIPADAKIEIIGAGFGHLEGPVWVKDSNCLLVSDTKAQITYKWSPTKGLSKFLENTGYTGQMPYSEEPGSNGMTIDGKGRLVMCEHGDRRVAVLRLDGKWGKQTLADSYQGKRFSSPNDIVAHTNGSLYFTDPPYGLPKKEKDPTREMTVNGVYQMMPNGTVNRLISDMTLPNGLALSADGKTLYVSQSDSLKPLIRVYPVLANGSLGKGKVFFDATSVPKLRDKEVPDGLKADRDGNIWAAGPGGLLIISPAGKLLGRIDTGEVIANCAWGDDGSTLYITSNTFLCRIKTTAKGIIPGKL